MKDLHGKEIQDLAGDWIVLFAWVAHWRVTDSQNQSKAWEPRPAASWSVWMKIGVLPWIPGGDGFVAQGREADRTGRVLLIHPYLMEEMPLMARLFNVRVHKTQKPAMDNRAIKGYLYQTA